MKDIKGYEGLYAITPEGEVWSYRRKKFLVPRKGRNGYLQAGLWKNGKGKNHYIHRLVSEAFIPNPENLPQVNHKDENKENNSVENLEWCTGKYNSNYGTINDKRKKPILQYTLNGEFVREWPSATDVELEERSNIYRSNIYSCLKGLAKSSYGYKWFYKE